MPAKPKSVKVELIKDDPADPPQCYKILRDFISECHHHLDEAKIAMAWHSGYKPNADGRTVLGKCKKGSDLDKALHGYDFVIILNKETWNAEGFGIKQKRALIDHELCHAQVATDKNGEVKRDTMGRKVYRTRKHDLEEFQDVVTRHGCYLKDIQEFAAACLKKSPKPLFKALNDHDHPELPPVNTPAPDLVSAEQEA